MVEVEVDDKKINKGSFTTSRSFICRLSFVRHWVRVTLAATGKNESNFGI